MIDYEKIAEDVSLPPSPEEAPVEVPPDAVEQTLRANRQYLPLDHEKYAGIAASKGYAQGDDFSGQRLLRVHYSHEAMIDFIITNPTVTQNEIAKQFGRSVSWISIVMGSDAFQAALAKRRDDLLDPELVATIEERFRGLADQSLRVIADKLEQTRNPDLALKALELSSKALGFGARNSQPTTTNNFVVALPPQIASASDWARAHQSPPPVILEG